MNTEKNNRGFDLIKFTDQDNVSCSLQESSRMGDPSIWLGCDNADPFQFVPGQGWIKIEMPEKYLANTRMILTQEQVKNLLPHLKKFVDTGEI